MSYKKNYNPNRYLSKNREKSRPKDITKDFFNWIWENRNNMQFGFVIRIDGMKRVGKSTLANIIAFEILKSNLFNRNIAFWTTSDKLVPYHIEAAPLEYKSKIKRVKKLSDIQNWDVVVVDEGIDVFDAKEALTIENRKAGKGLTFIGHKTIIFIICSVRGQGIITALRDDADIKIYKRVNKQYAQKSDSIFVKEHSDILLSLNKKQALLDSDHLGFPMSGGLEIDLKDYCPWLIDFDEKISLNMRDESLDSEETRKLRIINECKEVAKLALELYGSKRFIKPKAINLLRAWIREYHPEFVYLEKYITFILDHIILLIEEKKKQQAAEIFHLKIPEIVNKDNDDSCALFFRNFYKQNGFEHDKEFQDIIYQLIVNGMGIRQLVRYYGGKIKFNRIQSLLTKYQSGKELKNPELRLDCIYEEYIAKATGGIRYGSKGEIDIFYPDENGQCIGIAECKFYAIHIGKSHEFFQQIKDKNHNGKMNAAYEYCVKNGLKRYVLFFRIVNWGNFDICVPIEVEGPNKILIFDNNLEEYINNFLCFNKDLYFKNIIIKKGEK